MVTIRYINIDYSRLDLAGEHIGPRHIVDAQEWQEPTWQYPDCDSLDYECRTADAGWPRRLGYLD